MLGRYKKDNVSCVYFWRYGSDNHGAMCGLRIPYFYNVSCYISNIFYFVTIHVGKVYEGSCADMTRLSPDISTFIAMSYFIGMAIHTETVYKGTE